METNKPKMILGILFVAVGVAVAIAGTLFLRNSMSPTSNNPTAVQSATLQAPTEASPKESATTDEEKKHSNKDKGIDFEKYVVQKFSRQYFKLLEWAGDKHINGIYAQTTEEPDLKYEFTLKEETKKFAVECKYRSHYDAEGVVQWTDEKQFQRYKEYEVRSQNPVFVTIGVGGSPNRPKELFVIPLSKMESISLTKDFLEKYRKDETKNYYYDIKTNNLL